jgi:AcrR family transcriptional regulator
MVAVAISKTSSQELRAVGGAGRADRLQADEVARFVDAYLSTRPAADGATWQEALEGFAALIQRWRDADVSVADQMPALMEAAQRLASDRGFPAGELLSGVARLAGGGGNGRAIGESPARQRVLRAAYRIFAEKGFYSATVDEIADRAGVGKGTVYRHFESKENLFREVVEDRLQELIARIRAAFEESEDVLTTIRRAVLSYLRFFEEHQEFYRILVYEQQGFGTEFRARYIDEINASVPLIREMVVEASAGGRLKPLDDYYTIFYGLVGFVDGVIQKWFRNGCRGSLEGELDTILEVLFYGFVKNGARPRT